MRLFGRSIRFPHRPQPAAPRAALPPIRRAVEGLESRILFHLELISPLPDIAVAPGTTQSEVNLATHFDNEEINGTIVRLNTDLGAIDIEMFDGGAPATVQNFVGYVTRGDYNNTFFHRSIPGFIVQGGGYSVSTIGPGQTPTHIQTVAPVVNEFSAQRSNRRGTIAMAKVPPQPGQQPTPETINSATSEFFFNLEDNGGVSPGGLDFQNGGFTSFGQVINQTFTVVDAIAGLPFFGPPDVPFDPGTPNGGLPLQGTPPMTADNVVKIQTAQVIPEAGVFSYTVQSSDPVLVTPVVENGVLKLNYGAGQTGIATITITATDANGTVATDSFVTGVGELAVQVGNNAAKQAAFTDADGTTAVISLKGGTGTLSFKGSNLSQTVGKSGAVVQGNITDVAIDLTGTGTAGALTVKASGGDGLINVTRLTSDGGMKSIAAKQVNLLGNLTMAGNVGKADFADVRNSTMTFGGSGGGLALSLLNAEAVEINSQIPIKTLKATSFTGGGPDVGTITAPGIGSLTVTGDFNQRLDLAGGLGSAKVGGTAGTFLPWTVTGPAGKLAFGSFAEGFVADFLGGVASLAMGNGLTGDISATTIKTLTVKGDVNSANLILTGGGAALGKATISGALNNSRIQAASGIGTVTASSINASTIYAGANTDGGVLPFSLDEFAPGASSIGSVTVKSSGGAPSFVNSNIAARSIGKLSLGTIQAGNAGVPFGVAADTIASLAGTGTAPLKLSKLATPDQSTTQQEFEVRVF